MITALNVHGHCPWVVSQGGHPKHIILGIDMKIDDKIELKNNIDYQCWPR
jgi:hypothetical protein